MDICILCKKYLVRVVVEYQGATVECFEQT